jgi:hypothetical protein
MMNFDGAVGCCVRRAKEMKEARKSVPFMR